MNDSCHPPNSSPSEQIYAEVYEQIQREKGTFPAIEKMIEDLQLNSSVIVRRRHNEVGSCGKTPIYIVCIPGLGITAGITRAKPLRGRCASPIKAAQKILSRILHPEDEFQTRHSRKEACLAIVDPERPERLVRVLRNCEQNLTA